MSQLIPVVNAGFMYVNNLAIAVASNTTLTVGTGQCRDSNNKIDMTVASAITINAEVNGAAGLDTGTFAASTWYYVHVIADSTNNHTTSALISLSRTAPTLPAGYDSFRWIGQALSDGSVHFLSMYIYGSGTERTLFWDSSISVLSGGSATTLTAVTLTAGVPPIENTPVWLSVSFTPNTAADSVGLIPAGSTATTIQQFSGVVATKAQIVQARILSKLASSVAKIQYINSAASGATTLLVDGFDYSL